MSSAVPERQPRQREGDRHLAGISQDSFRLLIETNADGILVVDRAGRVLYANDAALEIFGYSLEDLRRAPLGLPLAGGATTEITVHRPIDKPLPATSSSTRSIAGLLIYTRRES